MKNRVITFGCRLNTYESSVIQDLSEKAGLTNTIVVNTCSVTKEAERQAKQAIRKLRKQNPEAKIIVTGCAAQIDSNIFSSMEEVNFVMGNQEKMTLSAYESLHSQEEKVIVNDIFSVTETAEHMVSSFEGKVRAFVQIQNGCNHRCTFCIIPFGRGNSRSVPIGDIVKQTQHLLDQGYLEVVLTGVDITAYGEDLPGSPTLGEMIQRLFNLVPHLKRLRLSSLDPAEIDPVLWHLIEHDERLLPHFHISLQAGDDLILKRMKRRHLRHHIVEFCNRVYKARPLAAIGADIIAGFPTETEDHFMNTYRILEECRVTHAHIFPYSPRPGTPASRMPQVPSPLIKERAARLREEAERVVLNYYKLWGGKRDSVLIESTQDGISKGKTDHFLPIIFEKEITETLISASITGFSEHGLKGEFINKKDSSL
jgi:threonylcarbamoyladenosine tRNA methylthiotransferase MtaB